MKEKHNGLATRRSYETPKAEIIEIGIISVLCGSSAAKTASTQAFNMNGNNAFVL